MAKGELLTVGSSNFIKKNFGVGYHLTITSKSDNSLEMRDFANLRKKIIDLVTTHIDGSKINP
jgi:hypothetical protein